MAKPYGKDSPERFIDGALDGTSKGIEHKSYQDSSTSEEIVNYPVDRPDQKIKTAFAMDNVGKVYGKIPTSLKDTGGIGGGVSNIKHSLTGASAVNEEVGASGSVKHVIVPWH